VHVARFPDAFVQAERILREAVRGGVTTVRDLGGDARALAELQRRVDAEHALLPTLASAAMFGGPDIYRGPPIDQFSIGLRTGEAPWAQSITAKTDLPLAIARAKGAGVDHIKIYGNLSPALARAIIAEATRQNVLTVAHATVFTASPADLVEAGAGTLSHAPYLVWQAVDKVPADYGMRISGPWSSTPPDHPRLRSLYRRMAERGVFLDATLYIYRMMNEYLPPEMKRDWTDQAFAWGAQATRQAHRAGVRVTTGTDWFEPREGELPHTHDELALLVSDAGFTPMEAIVSGTRNGALAMGLGETHGTLEIGRFADLLVLEADPSIDIGNTKRIRKVFLRGHPVE
jgi:imidazolonepropionase-like amidohydrolase